VLIRGPRHVDRLLQLAGLVDRLEIADLGSVQTQLALSEEEISDGATVCVP